MKALETAISDLTEECSVLEEKFKVQEHFPFDEKLIFAQVELARVTSTNNG